MAEDCAGSLQVCAMRLARLDDDGTPLVGADNMIVTNDFSTWSYSFEMSEGEDFEQKNACGDISVAYKEQDRIKRVNLGVTFTKPLPEVHDFLFGGTTIVEGGDVIGWIPPGTGENPNPNGVSAEIWTKAIVDGAQASDRPWIWWPWPRTKWVPADRSMGNEVHTAPFTGFTEQNPNWGDGPGNDWVYDDPTHFAWVRTDDIPTPTCGTLPLVGS